MRRAVYLAALLPAVAAADPAPAPPAPAPPAPIAPVSFEVLDRGDAVEVIAHNLKAARTAIAPIRSRLEVPLVGHPFAKPLAPGDATVKVIELDGDAGRVLSVKLNFERPDVKTLSRFAQAIQVGDDLHMLVPRQVPAEGTVPRIPEPTLPPELASQIAKAPPAKLIGPPPLPALIAPAAPAPPPARSGPPTQKAAAATTVATPPAPTAPVAAPPAAPTAPAPQTATGGASDPSNLALYGALGLSAVGAGLWLLKKRRANASPIAAIDVIAQRSLGGKARIVWLAAGRREMVVAVTAQSVRLLGQWPRTDEVARPRPTNVFSAVLPEAAEALEQREARPANRERKTSQGFTSPAVTGLLQLRAQTQSPVSDDVATGDPEADAVWAREILAATGGR